MFNLILVASNLLLGQYQSLDSCNKAIYKIYEQKIMPYPDQLSASEVKDLQKEIKNLVRYQRQYLCVKQ